MRVKNEHAVVTIDVDQRTFLPLRFVTTTPRSIDVVRVETDETVDGAKSSALFSTDGGWSYLNRRLDYRDLGNAVPFKVFSLGRTYRGLEIAQPTYLEDRDAYTPSGVKIQPEVFLPYTLPGESNGDAVIELTAQQAHTGDAELRLAAYRRYGLSHTVTMSGKERTVFFLGGSRYPQYFAVVIDDTLVQGRVKGSVSDAVTMLRDLRPTG